MHKIHILYFQEVAHGRVPSISGRAGCLAPVRRPVLRSGGPDVQVGDESRYRRGQLGVGMPYLALVCSWLIAFSVIGDVDNLPELVRWIFYLTLLGIFKKTLEVLME